MTLPPERVISIVKIEKLHSRLKNLRPGRLRAFDGTGSQASVTGG